MAWTAGEARADRFVYQTPSEYLASGDFNGDGAPDVLVVDRATGNARVGFQTNGVLTWSAPIVTGVTQPGAVAVGRFREASQDAIAVTAIALNRIQLVSVANPTNFPPSLGPSGLGPSLLVDLPAPSGITSNRDSLLIGSVSNSPGFGVEFLEMVAFTGDAVASNQDNIAESSFLERGNTLYLGANPVSYAAMLSRGGSNDQFLVLSPSNHFAPVAIASNLAPGGDYVFGGFNGEPLPRFIFYVPGQSNLLVRSLTPTNGGYVFDAAMLVALDEAVQRVFYVNRGTDGVAIVQFGDAVQGMRLPGGSAALSAKYQSGQGASGNVFTGVVPLTNGNLALLDAPAVGASATHAQVVNFNGTTFSAVSSGSLPALATRSSRANLWLFSAEPFVNPDPGFLASSNAPDWTSVPVISGGTLQFRTETDAGSGAGLGGITSNNFPALTGASFALADQYQDGISFFSYISPRAAEAVPVSISPPPGLYGTPISVVISTTVGTAKMFYRTNAAGIWQEFLSPFALQSDVSVQYYASNKTTHARSKLYSAVYSFGPSGQLPPVTPVDLAPGSTNPAPVFNTNQLYLSEAGTAFFGRRSLAALSPGFSGPSGYLSFADSPFSFTNDFSWFYLETFEDGLLNTPGISATAGWTVLGPSPGTDSVDADDGVIDGSGAGGHSFYSGGTQTNLTVTFNPAALGGHLPTHAGVVWTDVGNVLSGPLGYGFVKFTALDANGVTIGTTVAGLLGNGSGVSSTSEDRFFGVINPGGISSISITMTNSRDWEVDHLQYGYLDPTNFDGSIWAIDLDGSGQTYVTSGSRPRVSRDGHYMAFLREGDPFNNQGNLWVRNLANGQEQRLLLSSNSIVGYDWDRSNTNLVFDNGCGFWQIAADGTGLAQLPLALDCQQGAPAVNPIDGSLAFQVIYPGTNGLFVAAPGGSSRTRLNVTPFSPRWPAWSPGGDFLAVAEDNYITPSIDAGRNLWVIELTGPQTNSFQITGFTDNSNTFPHGAVWSPAGHALVGAGTLFYTNGVWLIPLDEECMCVDGSPILLAPANHDRIDFVGSVVASVAPPERIPQPGFFIRVDPDAIVVYWGSVFDKYTLEYSSDLAPNATWTPLPGPYDTDGYFFSYRIPNNALPQRQFFRLHYTGL